MARAFCLNEGECGHEWTLRKEPDEYESGIRCPSCGSTRVNAMATPGGEFNSPGGGVPAPTVRSGEEEAQEQATAEAQAAAQQPQQAAQGQQQPQQQPDPNAQMQAQQQGQQNLPAPGAGQNAAAGMQLGEGLASAIDADKYDLAEVGLGAGFSVLNHLREREKAHKQAARNTSQEQVKAVEDYPRCPACDGQLDNIPPNGGEFVCKYCDELLEV